MKQLLLILICFDASRALSLAWPPPSCPYGPCEVPSCCDSGIAVKVSNVNFASTCPDRGCFSCLSQQYLLGVHDRCSLDQSLMKSLCAPGLSCMIYCSKQQEGVEACWNRYGTCQHDHVPLVANQKFPGNVTVIPGLTMNDAKKAPKCTREESVCHCRANQCESKPGEKPWCFLANIKNPAQPTQNCYADVRWSTTYGSFFSSEACKKKMMMMSPDPRGSPLAMRAAPQGKPSTTTTATTTVPHPVDQVADDSFYWNFDQEGAHLQGQQATLGMLESQSLQQSEASNNPAKIDASQLLGGR